MKKLLLLSFLLLFTGLVSHAQLTITTNVCSSAESVRLTGPWWGWNPVGGPVGEDNGDGTWTITLDPTPADDMEYKLVVDGFSENLVPAGDFSCAPINGADYANRLWEVGSGNVSGITFGTCSSCSGLVTYGCTDNTACNFDATIDDGSCTFAEVNKDCYGNCIGQNGYECIYAPLSIDFEDEEFNFVDYGDGGYGFVVENPFIDAANMSSKVGKIIRTTGNIFEDNDLWAGSKLVLDDKLNFEGLNHVSMKVFTTAPVGTKVSLKLENSTSYSFEMRDAFTKSSNSWHTLEFDFTGTTIQMDELAFMFDRDNFGDGSEQSTFYFDDIVQFEKSLQVDLPVNFDDPQYDYTLTDFGGNEHIRVTDPEDENNKCIKVIKTNGAATWAGTNIGIQNEGVNPGEGFASIIPISLTKSKMSVRVWAPRANVPILLKVENSNTPYLTCETITNTNRVGWQTLTFDFLNERQGTAGLDVALVSGMQPNLASIFFDFGTEGSGETFYFDDVKFVEEIEVFGCMDSTANNYISEATDDDGSCEYLCTVSEEYLPQPFMGNTGANMTVMLTPDFMSSLPISSPNAYLVAKAGDLVVGSRAVAGVSQTTIAVWGDDTSTSEIDGASANASIYFQLVDGDKLYDVEMPLPVSYVTHGMSFQTSAATITPNCGPLLGCTDATACNYDVEAEQDDNTCQYPGCTNSDYIEYYSQGYTAVCDDGSCAIEVEHLALTVEHFQTPTVTGNSMTVGFDLPKFSGIEAATVGAFYDLNGDGVINTESFETEYGHSYSECIGLADYSEDFFTIGLWGDDSSTGVKDGLEEGDKEVVFALKTESGKVIAFNLEPVFSGYSSNGIFVTNQLNLDVTIYGCTDASYCNYDPKAEEDDGSCSGYFGCTDSHYMQFDSNAGCHNQNLCMTTWENAYENSQNEVFVLENTVSDLSEENLILEDTIDHLYQEIQDLSEAHTACQLDIDYWSAPIEVDLQPGWNMIGYTRKEAQDVVATLQAITENVMIVKNNDAKVYWPEFGFNGIGNFVPGHGYQIKIHQGHDKFTYHDTEGQRVELSPTVPNWVHDLEIEKHPNDIRTLVKVVNMLGQEVDPEKQFKGEVLLYLYNDASVEKKLVK